MSASSALTLGSLAADADLRPRRGITSLTAQGHPRTIFRRALERGNLVLAEVTAREVGRIDLREALELTALIALKDRSRSDRYRVRWLQRCLDEQALSVEDAVLVSSALSALGGPRHGEALELLRAATRS